MHPLADRTGGIFTYGSGRKHVVFHPHRPQWVVLNHTGYWIWQELSLGKPPDFVANGLASDYGISRETARKDVSTLNQSLVAAGLFPTDAQHIARRSPSARSLFLHLTSRCNLSCLHCYTSHRGSSVSGDLSARTVFGLIDQLEGLGGRVVTLSGGEPLLYPHIREIISRSSSKLDLRLLTNGTLLDREWAQFLADHNVAVQVSLDGSCPAIHDAIRGKGSFDKAIRAVGLLQQAGLSERINLSTTVMSLNFDDLSEIIALGEKIGVPLVRFLPLRKKGSATIRWKEIAEGFGRKEIEHFYDNAIHRGRKNGSRLEVSCGVSGFMLTMPEEASDEIWCPLGRQLAVDVDGSVYPCAAMMTPEFRLGSVHTEGVAELFQSAPMAGICRALTDRRLEIDRCAACTWRNLCQSGCMGLALEHKGTIWDTDDFCGYRQKLYREAFDRILSLPDHGGTQMGTGARAEPASGS